MLEVLNKILEEGCPEGWCVAVPVYSGDMPFSIIDRVANFIEKEYFLPAYLRDKIARISKFAEASISASERVQVIGTIICGKDDKGNVFVNNNAILFIVYPAWSVN